MATERRTIFVYPEIRIINEGPKPELPIWPERCPSCRAPIVERAGENTYDARCRYACGGMYSHKEQIQNHHNVWWGVCGNAENHGE